MEEKVSTRYVCEFCGSSYANKKNAEECFDSHKGICIACHKELERSVLIPAFKNCADISKIYAGYESEHDGTEIKFASICDSCLEKYINKLKENHIRENHIHNYNQYEL